ncbi:MAG: hypothetical protein RIK87_05955 [Fuerstiella sp.]
MFSRNIVVTLVLTASVMTGCGGDPAGPEKFTVSGQVSLNGEPLPDGDVIFRSADGGHAYAGKIQQGSFSFEAEAGSKQVEIKSYRPVPGKTREDNPGEIVQVTEQVVPAKYNDKSELTVSVEAGGDNAFTFELQGDPPKS